MKRLDLLPHDGFQVVWRENGDRRSPGHEVLGDLQELRRPKIHAPKGGRCDKGTRGLPLPAGAEPCAPSRRGYLHFSSLKFLSPALGCWACKATPQALRNRVQRRRQRDLVRQITVTPRKVLTFKASPALLARINGETINDKEE